MLGRVSITIVKFARWWLSELKGIFSAPRRLGAGRYRRRLVLSLEAESIRILDERTNQVVQLNSVRDGAYTLVDAVGELAEISQSQPRTPIGLRFGNKDCFVRQVEVPAAARDDIGKILELELERTTPFRRDDVFSAHYIDTEAASEKGQLAVRQLVVKRECVDRAVDAMSRVGVEPAFADCWNREGSAPLPVDFLLPAQSSATGRENGIGLVQTLVAVSVALALAAGATAIVRHQNALDDIEVATGKAKAQAHVVRKALDLSQADSARIASIHHLRRTRISAARILEEMTAVIPDSAWLSDFRIEGENVDISGYAKSAAALIPLIEKSKLFTGASLTAPVMLDTRHDKERFSIRVRVKTVNSSPQGHSFASQVNGK